MSMTIELRRQLPEDVELLAVPVCSDRIPDPDLALDWEYLAQRGFTGEVGQVQPLPGELGIALLALGVGPSAEVDPSVIRTVAALLSRHAKRQRVVATTLLDALPPGTTPGGRSEAAQALAEGGLLGSYAFTKYRNHPEPNVVERLVVVATGGRRVQAALEMGELVGLATWLARDLVNEPGGSLTPRRMAEVAVDVAEPQGMEIGVLEPSDIAEAGLGGLLGVNRGSEEPCRFVELCYEPENARGTVALVGKGITFDSGGLSIKPGDAMSTMKNDMGGAAALLGVFSALGGTKTRVRVRGYIPLTDNMTGGDATRPGDVLRIRNGKTVEVVNTDAEGRLILADALSLAGEGRPDAIIDVATLTGACQVALGNDIAGLMGNNADLVEQVQAAARRTGERVWELPLPTGYRRLLDSDVADMRNVGTGRQGGALVAGLFLREFVPSEIPWVHLDIAGTAWSDRSEGINQKGATGFGVRLLLDLLSHFRKPR